MIGPRNWAAPVRRSSGFRFSQVSELCNGSNAILKRWAAVMSGSTIRVSELLAHRARAFPSLSASTVERLVRKGLRVGRGYAALRALDDWLSAGPCAAREQLPKPFVESFCPSCWTTVNEAVDADFAACPNCGHGMILRYVQRPHACMLCGLVCESPVRGEHRRRDKNGDEGAPCDGELEAIDYLGFDVLEARPVIVLEGALLDAPAHLIETLPIHVPAQPVVTLVSTSGAGSADAAAPAWPGARMASLTELSIAAE
jgi:predicted RNA-binding Zn-ribbon protein involved in translation (DUF1610 family)